VVLASRLATVGYRVAIRTAVGGGIGQRCFRNLCYEFLLVSSFDAIPVQHVVDPKFRSVPPELSSSPSVAASNVLDELDFTCSPTLVICSTCQ
jgi:hypothetical protein